MRSFPVTRLLLGLSVAGVLTVGGARLATADNGHDDDGDHHEEQCDAATLDSARAAIDLVCDCTTSTNHGEYVACVAHVAKDLSDRGLLPRRCRGAIVACAADSTCGRPGFVTCCRTDARGHTDCSIKSSADQCKAPKGGTACVGTRKSCCDACRPGSTCNTTTTTVPTTTIPTTTTTRASTTTTTAPSTTTTTAPTTTSTSTTTTTAPTTTTTTSTTTSTTVTTAPTTTTTTASTTTTTAPGSPSAAFVA